MCIPKEQLKMRKAFDKIIMRIAKMLIPDARQMSVMAASAC